MLALLYLLELSASGCLGTESDDSFLSKPLSELMVCTSSSWSLVRYFFSHYLKYLHLQIISLKVTLI